MDGDASFGHWITLRRKVLRLSCVELARRVGCATVTLRKIETDERRPSEQIAAKLADHLDVASHDRPTFINVARGELGVHRLSLPEQIVDRPALAARAPLRTKLPIPPTPLVGRAHNVAAVRDYFMRADVRLLTLIGAPGIGKTRLSLQVALELHDTPSTGSGQAFADGVYFIPLAPIRDPDLVLPTIAQALGISELPGQPLLERLQAALRDKHMLLVLDNFEQVLKAALQLGELLAAAPRLTLLVTSRVALHLSGEQRFAVPPLALPPSTLLDEGGGLGRDWEALSQYAAVELFMTRARAALPTFVLSATNAPAIAAICRRLDGLPLAIELAAARVALFTAQELLARLDQRFALLTGGAVDLPTRQQTLRRAIDWSYELLDPPEQTLFRRLGVFVGGCTLEAAESICADREPRMEDGGWKMEQRSSIFYSPSSILDGLTALLDKSLLQREEGADGQSRFTMLETIREYALERLEASGEAEQLRRQHASYYLILSEANRSPELPQRPAQLAHLDSDYDNLWSALAWSQTSAGDPEVAIRMTRALRAFWLYRGIRREAIAALERTLNHPLGVGRTEAHAAARFDLAQFLGFTGNYAAARIQYEQVLPLAREVGDTYRYTAALQRLGWLAGEQGDSASAWARLSESLAIFRELGYAASIADTLNILAEVAILDEDGARAEALLAESRVLEQRENHDLNIIGWALNHLGHAAQLRGAYDRAVQLHHESLECFQAFGDQHRGFAWAYQSLGESALGLGRMDEAAHCLAQGLTISQTLSDQANMSWCLAGMGSVAALDEEPERAVRLWGAAERQRQAIGCRPAPAARATYERALAAAHAQLGEEAFAAAWAAGGALTLEQAIAEALQSRAMAMGSMSAPRGRSANPFNVP